ncbi:MAG: zinc ribbon domain-containing protein [Dehalococcoidales bacterium]|nr:zinc ribbon domain-containing protein [Dehalococcoidales bacterium]
MANCPLCETKVPEQAKFCQECGVRLSGAVSERAWIVAMQERIKSIRHSDIVYNVVSAIGLLIALVIPFVMRFVLLYNMDAFSWVITGIGALLFFGGIVANFIDDRKVKQIILQLQKGQPVAEPQEDEHNSTTTV